MIERLTISGFGPAPRLEFEFADRLNIITGDNGVGKTFILDLAWWTLTRTWADGRVMHPDLSKSKDAVVDSTIYGKAEKPVLTVRSYVREDLSWSPPAQGRPPSPGLIIYARVDGGFSLWDPARNYWREREGSLPLDLDRPDSFQFSNAQLWEGLKDNSGTVICRGLLEDWLTWQLKRNSAFDLLSRVLSLLSPAGPHHRLVPGEPVRLTESRAREIPTLSMPYGVIPITQASAGIRRILSLAYMVVWAWTEHQVAARERGLEETAQIVLLWDEVEAHLHPQWQRTILRAVTNVLAQELSAAGTPLQIIATTHAPLVLASLEPFFNPEKDQLFNLDLDENGQVQLEARLWAMQGDASKWLVSESFGLKQARSLEAQSAIEAAESWMRGERENLPPGLNTAEAIDYQLREVLAGHDRFWPRWIVQSDLHKREKA